MDLTNALWITLIGMGLVFVAILLLWGLMALLVRVTAEREPAEAAGEPAAISAPEASQETSQLLDRKRKATAASAAAAAVAVALASTGTVSGLNTSFTGREPQSANALSAWQAVNRARLISQRNTSSRKKVI